MEYNTTDIVERFVKEHGRKPTKQEYSDEYRRTHQSEIKETKRRYQETHREEIRERSHRYQIKRKEGVRLLRERLLAEEKERTQSHTRAHPTQKQVIQVPVHPSLIHPIT